MNNFIQSKKTAQKSTSNTNWHKTSLILLGIIILVRLISVFTMGLMPQDAYYYFYSEHLALSYFDHPPMVAYMLKLFSFLLGKSVVAVKLTDLIVTGLTVYSFYRLAGRFMEKSQSMMATMLLGTTLLVSVLSLNTTPDVPLMFFWTLSLHAIYLAVFKGDLKYWLLAGLMMGCSFDSKYTALFLPAGSVLFLMLSKEHRKYLLSKELLLAIVVFALAISPVIIWNIDNDWMSFKFQSSKRADSISRFVLQPKYFFGNLGTQIGLLLPILFGGVVYAFWAWIKKTVKNKQLPDQDTLFLLVFSLPIAAFFTFVSLFYWVKLNWIMPGYITAIILALPFLKERHIKYQFYISAFVHVALLIQVVFYPFPVKSNDTWWGWDKLADEVEQISAEHPDHFIFANDGYKTSAVLNFYMDEKIYAGNVLGKFALQFSLVDKDLSHLSQKNAIFLKSDTRIKSLDALGEIPEDLAARFDHVEEMEPILLKDSFGRVMRKFWVFRCQNYRLPE